MFSGRSPWSCSEPTQTVVLVWLAGCPAQQTWDQTKRGGDMRWRVLNCEGVNVEPHARSHAHLHAHMLVQVCAPVRSPVHLRAHTFTHLRVFACAFFRSYLKPEYRLITKGSVSYLSSPCFSTSIERYWGASPGQTWNSRRYVLDINYKGGKWSWVQFPRVTRSRASTLEAHSP